MARIEEWVKVENLASHRSQRANQAIEIEVMRRKVNMGGLIKVKIS
jgi:hypothetical protein